MKKLFLLTMAVALLAGCRTRYDITLNNNVKIVNVSRPTLDKETGLYHFKNSSGQEQSVTSMRVRVIEPHGDSNEPKFNPPHR